MATRRRGIRSQERLLELIARRRRHRGRGALALPHDRRRHRHARPARQVRRRPPRPLLSLLHGLARSEGSGEGLRVRDFVPLARLRGRSLGCVAARSAAAIPLDVWSWGTRRRTRRSGSGCGRGSRPRSPRHGPPPEPGDWPARRRVRHRLAAQALRRRVRGTALAGRARRSRRARVTQQLVYLEEYARARAPYISVNFVGLMHAGPTLIAEGTPEQQAAAPAGASCAARRSGARASRSRAPAPTSRRCGPERCGWATSTSSPVRRSGARARTSPTSASSSCAPIPTRRSTAASPGSSSRWISPASRSGRSAPSTATTTSARCSSTRCACRSRSRVGDEHDGWRVAQRHPALRTRAPRSRSTSSPCGRSSSGSSRWRRRTPSGDGNACGTTSSCGATVGRIAAELDALWRLTQMCVTEAERTGQPALYGSAVKLRYSELGQEMGELFVRVVGRPALALADFDGYARARGGQEPPLVAAVDHRGGHVADPAQPHRAAHPRPAPLTLTRVTLTERLDGKRFSCRPMSSEDTERQENGRRRAGSGKVCRRGRRTRTPK